MVIVTGTVQDKVPTIQYGSVTIGPVTISRPVLDGTDEEIINAARQVQRMAEYVCGVERRLLTQALDPASKVVNPATGEQFAAPPSGYDPSTMRQHPADAIPHPPSSGQA